MRTHVLRHNHWRDPLNGGASDDDSFDSALIADLARHVSGSVLGPQDAGYDAARAVHNGLIDRRPALIVRCRTTNDVVAALAFARRAGLEVSIRGGGHNVAGRAVTDGGVMIDLAEMKGIAIDPDRATATAEGGVDLGGAERCGRRARARRDRGTMSDDRHRRLHARRRPRLADGQVRARRRTTCSRSSSSQQRATSSMSTPQSHADLFWALRGGGGNFGVATSFTYRLHPVETVVGGLIAHPIDAAPELLRFYREAVADALGRPDRIRRAGARTGRLRRQARGARRLPHRRPGRGGARARAVQDLGFAAGASRSVRCRTR